MSETQAIQESSLHFDLAVRRALFHDVIAFFRRRSNNLLPYHEISRRTAPEGESYRGQQTVRLDQIIGSVNRFEEFDRSFMPRRRHARKRWTSLDRAWHDGVILPPVQLIRVGDVYFVKDGNHRVSVARQHGQEFIDAVVVEERLRAPLLPAMSEEELILRSPASFPYRHSYRGSVRVTAPTPLAKISRGIDYVSEQRWSKSIMPADWGRWRGGGLSGDRYSLRKNAWIRQRLRRGGQSRARGSSR